MLPLFKLSPVEMVDLYAEKLSETIEKLSGSRASIATRKVLMKRGAKRLRKLKRDVKSLSKDLRKRKIIYDTFHRVFQRLRWAEDSGSEREIELRVWCTSSVDLLEDTVRLLKEGI